MKTKTFPVLTALTLAAVLCGCDRSSGTTESDTTIPAVTNDTEKGSVLQVTVSHSYAAAQRRTELYTAEILPMAQGLPLSARISAEFAVWRSTMLPKWIFFRQSGMKRPSVRSA